MKKSVYISLLVVCLGLITNSAFAQVPVFSDEPVSDTICVGDTTFFNTLVGTGATPLTYMWQVSTDGGTMWDTVHNGAAYAGATNDTMRVVAAAAMHGNMYRVIAFNTDGTDTSMAATLNVDMPSAGTISGPSHICRGGATMLMTSSVAGGTWDVGDYMIDTIDAAGNIEGRAYGTDTVFYALTNTCGSFESWALVTVDTNMVVAPVTGPTHVCVGNMITLANTNVIGTHVWSTGMTGNASASAAGVITGVAGGLDTVTYTITNACNMVSSEKIITIETLPPAGTISGPSELCNGTWITLTSSVSGGVWISGTTSVAVVSSSGNVTGVSQGSSLISYYQANSCGASFSTHAVTVEVVAGPITGNDSVGIDSTLMLYNVATGGLWSSDADTIASIGGGGLVTGVDTGVTTIRYSVTNTCGTSSASITMNVGPLPDPGTISGPDSVCTGATVTLTPSVPGGVWTNKADTISSVSDAGIVTGIAKGRDSIYYTVTTAFGSSKVLKRMYVNTPPEITITGPLSVALGGSYTVSGLPLGGTWTTNNSAMTTMIGFGFFVVMDTGTSRFTYTARNTCGTSTGFFDVHLPGATSGISALASGISSMNVYPNPTQGALTININTPSTEKVMVAVMNVTGEKVAEFSAMTNTATNFTIDQPAGIYVLRAVTADGKGHVTRISKVD
jgi:hypothetical protein